MGQPASKTTAPFENYQVYTGQAVAATQGAAGAMRGGPSLPPSGGLYINNDFVAPPSSQLGYSGQVQPTRQEFYRAQRGGPMPQDRPRRGYLSQEGDAMDGMGMFQEDDVMSGMSGMGGRPRQPQFDPNMDPRFYPQQGGGMARDMIDDIRQQTQQRINPARAQNYRTRPPPQMQPNITRYRTVVDEPMGYAPPTQQGYSIQPMMQQAQPQQNSITPQQATLYYDPQTGVIQNPNQTATPQYGVQQNASAAQQPMYMSYQQPSQAAPTMGYQQAAPAAGYQQPMGYAMPQGYMMPQYGMQQQPIVIPAQILSGK